MHTFPNFVLIFDIRVKCRDQKHNHLSTDLLGLTVTSAINKYSEP
jgi:hypothetical protein